MKRLFIHSVYLCFPLVASCAAPGKPLAAEKVAPAGWLEWRGPTQNGVSAETGLPDTVSPETVGPFFEGQWTGAVAVNAVDANVVLTIDAGQP